MRTVECLANWIGELTLRIAAQDEPLNIPHENCALLVANMCQLEQQDYALYLLPPSSTTQESNLLSGEERCCVLPYESLLESGHFVQITANGHAAIMLVLSMDDLPDRALFLTGRCNSNCVMCPYTSKWRSKASDTPLELLLRCIELMDPAAPYLCITGGEPSLLKQEFFLVLDHVRTHFNSCLIHILTNGRAFYYESFFQKYMTIRPPKTLLGIPLYGHTRELHDTITSVQGSFEETTLGIDRLYRSGERIELRIVLTALNSSHLLDLAKYICERYPRVYVVCIMGLEMLGNAYINRTNVWIDYDASTDILATAVDYLVQHGVQTQIYNMPLCKVNHRHWSLCQKSISTEKVAFFPECDFCKIRSSCGGFFRSTILMSGIRVAPYTGCDE